MHISRHRQSELRYGLLYAQAHELTITDFFSLYIQDQREAAWFQHWIARYSTHQQARLDRQFEIHKLLCQIIDNVADPTELTKLTPAEAKLAGKILSAKVKQLMQGKEEKEGAPVKHRVSTNTTGPTTPSRPLYSPSLDYNQDIEIKLGEYTYAEDSADNQDSDRDQDTEETSGSIRPVSEEEEHSEPE